MSLDTNDIGKPRGSTIAGAILVVLFKLCAVLGLLLLALLAFTPRDARAEAPQVKAAPSWTRLATNPIDGTSWHASGGSIEGDTVVVMLRFNNVGKVHYLRTVVPLDACEAGRGTARVGVETLSFDLDGPHLGDRIAMLVCTAGEHLQRRATPQTKGRT